LMRGCIEVGDKIINQHPPIPLRRRFGQLIRWLTEPSDGVLDVFPAIASHPCHLQIDGRKVIQDGATSLSKRAAISSKI
jgi:hypothetical protein